MSYDVGLRPNMIDRYVHTIIDRGNMDGKRSMEITRTTEPHQPISGCLPTLPKCACVCVSGFMTERNLYRTFCTLNELLLRAAVSPLYNSHHYYLNISLLLAHFLSPFEHSLRSGCTQMLHNSSNYHSCCIFVVYI